MKNKNSRNKFKKYWSNT